MERKMARRYLRALILHVAIISAYVTSAWANPKRIRVMVPPRDSATNYASFVIAPGPPPSVLAEEQDKFEFPDKRVSVTKIAGPTFEYGQELRDKLRAATTTTTSTTAPPSTTARSAPVVDNVEEPDDDVDRPYTVHVPAEVAQVEEEAETYAHYYAVRDQFVKAGSVFWSEVDGALYVSDAYAGQIHRFLNPSLAKSKNGQARTSWLRFRKPGDKRRRFSRSDDYDKRTISMRKAFLSPGLVGPAVPLNISLHPADSGLDLVSLSAGYNSDYFNLLPWDMDDAEAEALPQSSYEPASADGAIVRLERYNRLSFGVKDPEGRIISASVDIRDGLQPHPCMDFLVSFHPDKLSRVNHFLNDLRHGDVKMACSPAGIAFAKPTEGKKSGGGPIVAYYADRVMKKLIRLWYDVESGAFSVVRPRPKSYSRRPKWPTRALKRSPKEEEGEENEEEETATAENAVLADFGAFPGLMTGLVEDNDGVLWTGFRGTGEIVGYNPETGSIADVITIPAAADGLVADLAFDRVFSILYVLTDRSLLHYQL